MYRILFLSVCILVAQSVSSQSYYQNSHRLQRASSLVKRYMDSLAVAKVRADSIVSASSSLSVSGREATFRLFAPLTFYRDVPVSMLSITDKMGGGMDDMVSAALMSQYLNRPDLVQATDRVLDGGLVEATPKEVAPVAVELVKKAGVTPSEPEVDKVNVVVVKPNFWEYKGDYFLQFLQNFVSSNWYKGGESNYSMVGAVTLQANYNNKQKVKWSNKLEMKLGFQTSQSDTLRRLKTSEDLIRYTGKLGLQASKRWYYTVQLVANTQFMRAYRNNDLKVYSDFASPLNTNLSLGMDYSVDWLKSRLKGSIHLAPLAYNFRYVNRLALSTRYGLKPDRHTLHDFGSEFTVDLFWKFSDMISWQTRLYGYTTYKRSELEWENTFTFQFNKYISTKVFLYPRFDDGTARDDRRGYWQLKEYASVGFSYSM